MIVHLYTRCWNDAHMLPFMFRHYDPIVQRYVVFDDGSTDSSLEILASNPKVEMHSMPPYSDPTSRVASGTSLQENCWQESRGVADWVIITDIDEHLYHRDLNAYLAWCKRQGITLIPALGYQMLSEIFPDNDILLCGSVTTGAVSPAYNKLSVFSPDRVRAINFAPGRHSAVPEGEIIAPDEDELLLLHYKYLGFEQTHARHQQSQTRQREKDIAREWGHQYNWSRERLREDWKQVAAQIVDVTAADYRASDHHPWPRWWDGYRRSERLQPLSVY